MPIVGTKPIDVPAISYDIWWMQSFTVFAPSPEKKVKATFTLVPQNSETNEIDPKNKVSCTIDDVLTFIQSNASSAQAFGAVLQAVQDIAKAQKKI